MRLSGALIVTTFRKVSICRVEYHPYVLIQALSARRTVAPQAFQRDFADRWPILDGTSPSVIGAVVTITRSLRKVLESTWECSSGRVEFYYPHPRQVQARSRECVIRNSVYDEAKQYVHTTSKNN